MWERLPCARPARTGPLEGSTFPSEDRRLPCLAGCRVRIAIVGPNCARLGTSQGSQPEFSPFSGRMRAGQMFPPSGTLASTPIVPLDSGCNGSCPHRCRPASFALGHWVQESGRVPDGTQHRCPGCPTPNPAHPPRPGVGDRHRRVFRGSLAPWKCWPGGAFWRQTGGPWHEKCRKLQLKSAAGALGVGL